MKDRQNNPLLKVKEFGQSIWLDYISREIINNGKLKKLIDEDGICGVTSNPSIFEKAIDKGKEYKDTIHNLVLEDKSKEDIYEELTIQDIQSTADILRPVFDEAHGQDGFISLEVSPYLAHKTEETINEARHLWRRANRSNVMIKVPAIRESIPAIRQLISAGLNINITLLFGLDRYKEVIEAYLSGLEDRLQAGKPIGNIASVASFFLSRIDVLVDPILKKIIDEGGQKSEIARSLVGQTAISNAKLAYRIYQETFSSDRFRTLSENGAHTQRLLWASTSTKNPEYSDIKYVEPLIGPDTINTMPEETIDAYRDHGNPAKRLEEGVDKAFQNLQKLKEIGIDINEVTHQLEVEAVDKFIQPYDKLMQTLDRTIKTEQQDKNTAK
ncbi:MAG: transaldolase [Ignavibacteriales bacterium]